MGLDNTYIKVDSEVELKALNESDAPALYALTDGSRNYLAKYLPWVDSTLSVNDSFEFIKDCSVKRNKDEQYAFGIFYKGELVGHMSLMKLKHPEDPPEIGYWISQSYSGKGVTKRATEALTEFGLNKLGLERIVIRAVEDNIGSNRIAESLGYNIYEKEVKDGYPHNYWDKLKG